MKKFQKEKYITNEIKWAKPELGSNDHPKYLGWASLERVLAQKEN